MKNNLYNLGQRPKSSDTDNLEARLLVDCEQSLSFPSVFLAFLGARSQAYSNVFPFELGSASFTIIFHPHVPFHCLIIITRTAIINNYSPKWR